MKKKAIIYGGNDMSTFSVILKKLKQSIKADFYIATRTTDLLNILQTLEIDMVILNFRNNALELNNMKSFIGVSKIPIVCLEGVIKESYQEITQGDVVFVIPQKYALHTDIISTNIRSIFRLCRNHKVTTQPSDKRNKGSFRYILELEQKNKALSEVQGMIDDLWTKTDGATRTNLASIANSMHFQKSNTHLWKDFKAYFENQLEILSL